MYTLFLSIALIFSSTGKENQTEFFDAADAVFSTYVSDGKVDYAAIKSNPEKLEKALETAKITEVSIDNPEVYKAFWINAYNLAVIKGVVDNYPLKSPLDVDGFFDGIK
ncbi:MAG: DUF547 domain-containing protein, partial [Leeuwenhoekiella sp.]